MSNSAQNLDQPNENADKISNCSKEKNKIEEKREAMAAEKKNDPVESIKLCLEKKKENAVEGLEQKKDDTVERLQLGLEKLSLKKTKKLIIIPLGGFLCHRIRCGSSTSAFPPARRPPDVTGGKYSVYKRPHCEEFLEYCLKYFDVAIWSSAIRWNVDTALRCIDDGIIKKILFIWNQDDCMRTKFGTPENPEKKIFLRDLSKVWNRKWRKGIKYSPDHILMIENEPSKCLLNPPNTSIFLDDYEARMTDDSVLGPESPLRTYLAGLADAPNVPSYVKQNPFGNPDISEGYPHWDYYKQVIQQYKPIVAG